MIFEFIGTVMAGLAAGMLAWAIRRFSPARIPGWLIPVAGGAAMIATTISNEQGWYTRVTDQLPPTFVIAQTVEETAFYRPWTYLQPMTTRFIAVDTNSVRQNATVPDQRIVEVYFFGRWAPTHKVPVLFDCAGARTASLIDGADFAADGTVANASWEAMAADDPVFRAACGSA